MENNDTEARQMAETNGKHKKELILPPLHNIHANEYNHGQDSA